MEYALVVACVCVCVCARGRVLKNVCALKKCVDFLTLRLKKSTFLIGHKKCLKSHTEPETHEKLRVGNDRQLLNTSMG